MWNEKVKLQKLDVSLHGHTFFQTKLYSPLRETSQGTTDATKAHELGVGKVSATLKTRVRRPRGPTSYLLLKESTTGGPGAETIVYVTNARELRLCTESRSLVTETLWRNYRIKSSKV